MYINLPERRKRGERNTDNLYSLSGWVVECLMWAECGGDAYEERAGNDTIAGENSAHFKTDAGDDNNNTLGGLVIVTLLKLMVRDSEYVVSIKFDKNS